MKSRAPVTRGPSDCFRTASVSAPCDVCGVYPEILHIPMHGSGFRCAEHCENCTLGGTPGRITAGTAHAGELAKSAGGRA